MIEIAWSGGIRSADVTIMCANAENLVTLRVISIFLVSFTNLHISRELILIYNCLNEKCFIDNLLLDLDTIISVTIFTW